MYRGRIRLGGEAILGVQTTSDGVIPALPTSTAPLLDVYDSVGHVVSKRIPLLDRDSALFQYRLFLGSTFTAGLCTVTYRWTTGSYEGYEMDTFEIIPGGNADGIVLSMTFYKRPMADFVLRQTNAGVILRGKNPKV